MTDDIPLDDIAPKLGLSVKTAYKRASLNRLPFPTFRIGTQKSKRFVMREVWERHLMEASARAEEEWRRSNEA